MLTMSADKLFLLLALCFVCVSSNDELDFESSCEEYLGGCETHELRAPLGSSVFLPCIFSTSSLSRPTSPSLNWTAWIHAPKKDLVKLRSDGRVKFWDHRYGRVKVFPNQGSKGNYTIRIDELKNSDLGCYRCKQENGCLQLELAAEIGTQNDEMLLLMIYICVGVAAFILLIIGGYLCVKCILWCNGRTQDNMIIPLGAGTEGASAPPLETVMPVEHLRGADNLVYENDGPTNQQGDPTRNHCSLPGYLPDPDRTQPTPGTSGIYPNLNQFNFERMESRRTKQRFHTELFSRLRQASLSRHYYVNQGELRRQQAMQTQGENRRKGLGKKKVKENCEFKNPIYNRSTDQLNRL